MADRTLTSSPAWSSGKTPKAVFNGDTSVPFSWTSNGVTLSASDHILLAKIPNKATLIGLVGAGWTGADGGCTVRFGLSHLSADYVVSTVTLSATATTALTLRAGAFPVKVSLSDDATNQFVYLTATVVAATSATVTNIIKGTVTFTMDGL